MAKIKRTDAPVDLIDLQDTSNSQIKKILHLNNQFAKECSKLDIERLEFMIEEAFAAIAISPDIAFFLAYNENSKYDGVHYTYLKEKFENFIYLDRIIVKKAEQGMGIGTSLYECLFELTEEAGAESILCEVNVEPPNDISHEFHLALGFEEIEDRQISDDKIVRYYKYDL